jgi:hypothetical protein
MCKTLGVAGTAGSNPTGGMYVCLLCVLYVVRYRPLRRADQLSRVVLQREGVLCVCVCVCVCVIECEQL